MKLKRGLPASVACLCLLVASCTSSHAKRDTQRGNPDKPNIVILMLDDQRWDTVTSRYMPNTFKYLIPNGITFTNSFISNSFCCPSRASTLTGEYSHTTGVYDSLGGTYGGFEAFTNRGDADATIATDLHQAGYRTALVGKYLNGFPRDHYDYHIPGWDSWFAIKTGAYYNYYADSNTSMIRYGNSPADYATTVLTNKALAFIRSPRSDRFFLYLAFTAPHFPAIPDPRDVGKFQGEWPMGAPPSFGVTEPDKPAYVAHAPWTPGIDRRLTRLRMHQLECVYGVDRAIGKIWSSLPDNTLVLLTNDNGLMWGEHRKSGKQMPYNESIRVPMILAGKNLATPLKVGGDPHIALNVDILSTLESYAGLTVRPAVEGLNLLGATSRRDFVLEHWSLSHVAPTFCGVRSVGWMYTKYTTREEELYNDRKDPYEMNNLVDNTGNKVAQAELAKMRARAGVLCTEGTVYPPGWPTFP